MIVRHEDRRQTDITTTITINDEELHRLYHGDGELVQWVRVIACDNYARTMQLIFGGDEYDLEIWRIQAGVIYDSAQLRKKTRERFDALDAQWRAACYRSGIDPDNAIWRQRQRAVIEQWPRETAPGLTDKHAMFRITGVVA
jgi:hypothetical protein